MNGDFSWPSFLIQLVMFLAFRINDFQLYCGHPICNDRRLRAQLTIYTQSWSAFAGYDFDGSLVFQRHVMLFWSAGLHSKNTYIKRSLSLICLCKMNHGAWKHLERNRGKTLGSQMRQNVLRFNTKVKNIWFEKIHMRRTKRQTAPGKHSQTSSSTMAWCSEYKDLSRQNFRNGAPINSYQGFGRRLGSLWGGQSGADSNRVIYKTLDALELVPWLWCCWNLRFLNTATRVIPW